MITSARLSICLLLSLKYQFHSVWIKNDLIIVSLILYHVVCMVVYMLDVAFMTLASVTCDWSTLWNVISCLIWVQLKNNTSNMFKFFPHWNLLKSCKRENAILWFVKYPSEKFIYFPHICSVNIPPRNAFKMTKYWSSLHVFIAMITRYLQLSILM